VVKAALEAGRLYIRSERYQQWRRGGPLVHFVFVRNAKNVNPNPDDRVLKESLLGRFGEDTTRLFI
jgi:hypothetical protein